MIYTAQRLALSGYIFDLSLLLRLLGADNRPVEGMQKGRAYLGYGDRFLSFFLFEV